MVLASQLGCRLAAWAVAQVLAVPVVARVVFSAWYSSQMPSIGTLPEILFAVLVFLPAGVLRSVYRNAANIGRDDSTYDAHASLLVAAAICSIWLVPSWGPMVEAFAGVGGLPRADQAVVLGTSFALLVLAPTVIGVIAGLTVRWQYDFFCKWGLISRRTTPLFDYLTSKHHDSPLFVRFRQKNARDEHESVFIGSIVRADESSVIVEQIREYEDGKWSEECLPECTAIVWTDGRVMWFETQPEDEPPATALR